MIRISIAAGGIEIGRLTIAPEGRVEAVAADGWSVVGHVFPRPQESAWRLLARVCEWAAVEVEKQ